MVGFTYSVVLRCPPNLCVQKQKRNVMGSPVASLVSVGKVVSI